MTPEQIKYLREWATSGNGVRDMSDVFESLQSFSWALTDQVEDYKGEIFNPVVLNKVGLLVAKLASAFEQACGVADAHAEVSYILRLQDELEKMWVNRRDLLGPRE